MTVVRIMRYYVGSIMCDSDYIQHHGIKGQRWGIRRFQNEDGSLTDKGRKRYLSKDGSSLSLRGKMAFFSRRRGHINWRGRHMLKTAGKDSEIGKAILARREELKKRRREYMKEMRRKMKEAKYQDNDKQSAEFGEEWKEINEEASFGDFGRTPESGKSFVDSLWSSWDNDKNGKPKY